MRCASVQQTHAHYPLARVHHYLIGRAFACARRHKHKKHCTTRDMFLPIIDGYCARTHRSQHTRTSRLTPATQYLIKPALCARSVAFLLCARTLANAIARYTRQRTHNITHGVYDEVPYASECAHRVRPQIIMIMEVSVSSHAPGTSDACATRGRSAHTYTHLRDIYM